jgi:putative flippase GtrA
MNTSSNGFTLEGATSARRAVRFAGVGLVGFVVQLAALHLLATAFGLHEAWATALAVEAAILHNFVWHERWTWSDRRLADGSRAGRFLRFNGLAGLLSIGGNVAFTTLYRKVFGLPLAAANALAVGTLSLASFVAADRWVFGRRRSGCPRFGVTGILAASLIAGPANRAAAGPSGSQSLAGPRPETVVAWNRYVAATETRLQQELHDTHRFLAVDFEDSKTGRSLREALRGGGVRVMNVANEATAGEGVPVPSGMIHHWRGYAFIPGATVDDLLASVKDPEWGRVHRQEDVIESRVLERRADGLRLYLKLQRSAVVTVVYATEHDVRYERHDDGRASSRSVATRIAEIQEPGTPAERLRPPAEDRGFLWRLNSYWRYEAVPGGVVVELESLTLSRDLPWGLRTLIRPLVSAVARESIERTLAAVRERVTGGIQGP